jgi:hypothetical protein
VAAFHFPAFTIFMINSYFLYGHSRCRVLNFYPSLGDSASSSNMCQYYCSMLPYLNFKTHLHFIIVLFKAPLNLCFGFWGRSVLLSFFCVSPPLNFVSIITNLNLLATCLSTVKTMILIISLNPLYLQYFRINAAASFYFSGRLSIFAFLAIYLNFYHRIFVLF